MLVIKIRKQCKDRCHVGAGRTVSAITCKTPPGNIQEKWRQELYRRVESDLKKHSFLWLVLTNFMF